MGCSWPCRAKRTPDGEFKDIAHPINSETREIIQSAVLLAYNEELERVGWCIIVAMLLFLPAITCAWLLLPAWEKSI